MNKLQDIILKNRHYIENGHLHYLKEGIYLAILLLVPKSDIKINRWFYYDIMKGRLSKKPTEEHGNTHFLKERRNIFNEVFDKIAEIEPTGKQNRLEIYIYDEVAFYRLAIDMLNMIGVAGVIIDNSLCNESPDMKVLINTGMLCISREKSLIIYTADIGSYMLVRSASIGYNNTTLEAYIAKKSPDIITLNINMANINILLDENCISLSNLHKSYIL